MCPSSLTAQEILIMHFSYSFFLDTLDITHMPSINETANKSILKEIAEIVRCSFFSKKMQKRIIQ